LRIQLNDTKVKVFELAGPGAKTRLNEVFGADEVDSRILTEVTKLVKVAIREIEKDTLEIRPGLSKIMKVMSRIAPELVVNVISRPLRAMLAPTSGTA
jgi:uncharacterized oxidoreductase